MQGNAVGVPALALAEHDNLKQASTSSSRSSKQIYKQSNQYKWHISWRNVLVFVYLHTVTLYWVFLLFTGHIMFLTVVWSLLNALVCAFGITAGAHRLWAHKAYKATWQLRVILAIFQTMAFQNHIYEWVRDHRVHHKFTDTDADPHNAKRGFFFSHIGWLMVKKHSDVKTLGATVDMSDLEKDPVVMWQRRLYVVLMPVLAFVIPTAVPYYVWGEAGWLAWYSTVGRYTLSLNGTWLVNSAAHIWGNKPYDATMSPSENKYVGIIAVGEGWHNYHHVFPWDYKAAELGNYGVNLTTGFIDLFAKIGWAYNLRTVSKDVIIARAIKKGDGTLREETDPHHHMNSVWGWGDPDLSPADRKACQLRSYISQRQTVTA